MVLKTNILLAAVFALSSFGATAKDVKVVTWNMEHLAAKDGEGCFPREQRDYEALANFASTVKADIYAVQEVESVDALKRVFPEDKFDYVISDRASTSYECDDFYPEKSTPQRVGFAIRKDINYIDTKEDDLNELTLNGKLRYGIAIELPDANLKILNVHLKSGCWGDPISKGWSSCKKLRQQLPILKDWIADNSTDSGVMVLGDFNRRLAAPGDTTVQYLGAGIYNAVGVTPGCHPKYPDLIDHILLTPKATDLLKQPGIDVYAFGSKKGIAREDKMLSDHCPISVTLEY
ncbi:endonuclease/exonuclease/phosphatase family protein [Grimontia sp. AD028]|uniref:endonuclease/exonuclease/phosphatase family protein n=1 Tax=Grimontia sp. AD028 TaxID=1581149 RepID=UPI0006960EE2|nr:endonuclease/exonuclease/phosphatase family protein [Grimontia sp. AD028]